MMTQRPEPPPDKSQIAAMEKFAVLSLDRIEVVTRESQAKKALEDMRKVAVLGFDTETRPTFQRGQKVRSPDLYQFSTLERAYLFPACLLSVMPVVGEVLEDERILKVGFDLKNDMRQIEVGTQVSPMRIMDVGREFRGMGYRNTIGASVAVAMMFRQAFVKPKSVTTSNWSLYPLSERQMVYAANDAYVALRVYEEMRSFKSRLGLGKGMECQGEAKREG